MPSRDGGPAAPPRRTVLAGLLGGLAGGAGPVLLSGCGIRLEDDAPRIPLLPTREPVPDESVLLVALARAEARAAAAPGTEPASVALPAGERAREQAVTLRSLLDRRGVPLPPPPSGATASGTTAATSTATPSATAPDPATRALGDLSAGPTAAQLTSLAVVTPTNRSLVGSLDVEQAVTAALIGSRLSWPASAPPPDSAAVSPLQAVRSAVYGLQVASAQSDDAGRTLLAPALSAVQGWQSLLLTAAGEEAPAQPLGYTLPFPVTTPVAAHRLARQVLTDLVPPLVGALPSASGVEQVTWLVRTATQTQLQATRLGAEVEPFPGMTT